MQFIKSLFFNIFLYIGITLVFFLAMPALILPAKFTLYCGKFLAYYIIFLLKVLLNTKVIFHGLENLKKFEKFTQITSNVLLTKQKNGNNNCLGGNQICLR